MIYFYIIFFYYCYYFPSLPLPPDKTIKLWKIYEKEIHSVYDTNFDSTPQEKRDPTSITSLRVPKIQKVETAVAAVPRRVYANAHAYHINSISVNSDHETFLSADDLRINLWNLSINDQSFNMVDIKPANMEELTEVITAAEFHPSHCNQFMYSSSKGTIKLCDQRASALCDSHAKCMCSWFSFYFHFSFIFTLF